MPSFAKRDLADLPLQLLDALVDLRLVQPELQRCHRSGLLRRRGRRGNGAWFPASSDHLALIAQLLVWLVLLRRVGLAFGKWLGSGLGSCASSTLPLHLPFFRFVGFGSVHTAQTPHLFGRPPLVDIRRVAPLHRRGERGYHPKNAAWPHQFRSGDGAKPQSPARKTGLPEPIASPHSVQFCTIVFVRTVTRISPDFTPS